MSLERLLRTVGLPIDQMVGQSLDRVALVDDAIEAAARRGVRARTTMFWP
jgi:hypothetical protein